MMQLGTVTEHSSEKIVKNKKETHISLTGYSSLKNSQGCPPPLSYTLLFRASKTALCIWMLRFLFKHIEQGPGHGVRHIWL